MEMDAENSKDIKEIAQKARWEEWRMKVRRGVREYENEEGKVVGGYEIKKDLYREFLKDG